MEEWCLNELYEKLLKMPLWIHAAFDGGVTTNKQFRLLISLVEETEERCPVEYVEAKYRENWVQKSLMKYVACVDNALEKTKDI